MKKKAARIALGIMLIVTGIFILSVFTFAADTYTSNYNLRLPDLDVEDPVTPWGQKYNDNFTALDTALNAVAVSSGSNAAAISALQVSTGAIKAQVDAIAVATGTNTGNIATNTAAIAALKLSTGPIAGNVIDIAALKLSTSALEAGKVNRGGDTMTGDLTLNTVMYDGSHSTGNFIMNGTVGPTIKLNNINASWSTYFLGEIMFEGSGTGKHRIITYGDTHATYPKEMQIGADSTSAGTNVRITGQTNMNPSVFVSSWTSVGINTASPSSAYNLDVNGAMRATSFTGSGSGLTSASVPNAALVTPVIPSSATGTYPLSITGTVPAASVSAGSLGSQVIASSITLAAIYGAPTLTGTNFTAIPNAALVTAVIPSSATGNYLITVASATAFKATPTGCGASQYATGIDVQGNLTCATPAGAGDMLLASTQTVSAAKIFTSSVNITGAFSANYGSTYLNLDPLSYSGISGAWTIQTANTQQIGTWWWQSAGGNGNYLEFIANFYGGTYTFRSVGFSSTDRGKMDIQIDGSALGTIDNYSAAPAYNYTATVTGINILPGIHTVKIICNGKNASSSNYYLNLTRLFAWRTGP